MNKIEKLERRYIGPDTGCGGATFSDVIDKVNEIIDALNGKEEPELRESEDERMLREFNDYLCEEVECRTYDIRDEKDRRTLNMLCYVLKKVDAWLEKQKEQKPASTEDMPYITDEHFYEREPADSFKYKLAEYMTRCCTKKEGPYGYEYGISAESILKMAEEELIKRGVVQKPVGWSEEDEKMIKDLLWICDGLEQGHNEFFHKKEKYTEIRNFLKALRPQKNWKPSEEQIHALERAIIRINTVDDIPLLTELRDKLKAL